MTVVLTAVTTAGATSRVICEIVFSRPCSPSGCPASSHFETPRKIFSVIIIPISTIVPIAIAIPASDMMLASTPNVFIAMNAISTATGSVVATTRLARTCNRNRTITAIVIAISCQSALVSVPIVSSTNSVRS